LDEVIRSRKSPFRGIVTEQDFVSVPAFRSGSTRVAEIHAAISRIGIPRREEKVTDVIRERCNDGEYHALSYEFEVVPAKTGGIA
jgi:hypothetical protein